MRRIASMAQGYQICHCEERSDVAISQNPTGQQESHRRNRNCVPEIAPQGHFLALRAQGAAAPLGPRNDKLGGIAPQNPCNICCQLAWRSLSAATDAIGAHHFNGGLYGLQVRSREGHVPPLQRAAEVLRILHSSFFSLPYSFTSVPLPYKPALTRPAPACTLFPHGRSGGRGRRPRRA